MYIITIHDYYDGSFTRVAMGCHDWAERFLAFMNEQHEMSVHMEEGPLPDDRSVEELAQAHRWLQHFTEYSNIGACIQN